MNKSNIIIVQIIFLIGIILVSQDINLNDREQWFNIARYILYILIIKSLPSVCLLLYDHHDLPQLVHSNKLYALLFITSAAITVYYKQSIFKEHFVYISLACLVIESFKSITMEQKSMISYGVGMACSFFEGYLIHVIPSDGHKMVGFAENIRAIENNSGVCFPVKKLFLIITKSMFCPPDLADFNKGHNVPYLEAFTSLEEVVRNVAGVHGRQYRNTAYRIYRGAERPPVSLAAECATPLHTLHRVLNNRTLYQEVANIDVQQVTADFCRTLTSILDKSPQCRGKCELVFFDDEDPSQNLAEVLLERIKQLEPNFEEMLDARMRNNYLDE